MCKFKNFIVAKNKKVYMMEEQDSYDEIIKKFNLDDSKKGKNSSIVKIKISSLTDTFSTSMKNWKIEINEEKLPTWFENDKKRFINGCLFQLFSFISDVKKNKETEGSIED